MRSRLLMLVGLLFVPAAQASDWLAFRGPTGQGSAEGKPPTTWTATEGRKWTTPLPGPGSSSPIVVGKYVFVTCYSGYGVDARSPGSPDKLVRHLVCLDRATGKVFWTAEVPGTGKEDDYRGYLTEHGYASSTPVSDGKAVYAFFGKSGVYAYDLEGKMLWKGEVGTESDVRRWGSAASPILYQNLVIVNASSEGRAVFAFDKTTGKIAWKAEGSKLSLSFSTPAIVAAAGREDLVVAMPGEVWGLNPLSGKMRWVLNIGPNGNITPAVIPGDGLAFITGGFQTKGTLALRPGKLSDTPATEIAWTGRVSSYVPTPVLAQDRLTMVTEDGLAIRLNAKTGEPIYQERLPVKGLGGASRPFYASAVRADGRLYVPSRRAGVFVLADSDRFEVLATNPALDDTDFNGSPAIADGQIFLRSNKALYCLEGK